MRSVVSVTLFTLLWAIGIAAQPPIALRAALYIDSEWWPMVRNGSAGPEGFEPSLLSALCRHMNATCTVIPLSDSLPSRLDTVTSGDVDFSIGSIVVTPERWESVDFVKPYYLSSGTALFAPNGTVDMAAGWPGLAASGAAVCMDEGNFAQGVVEKLGIGVSIIPAGLPTEEAQAEVDRRIAAGECVGTMMDSTFLIDYGLYQAGLPALEPAPYGIAVGKNNTELRRALSAAMVEMMGDGDASEILALEKTFFVDNGIAPNPDLAAVVDAVSNFVVADEGAAPAPGPVPAPSSGAETRLGPAFKSLIPVVLGILVLF